MSMYDDSVHEPFGPEYVRPVNPDCPDCDCCTAALCAVGRARVNECAGNVDDQSLIERVTDCPCSAESTEGTLAWRAAMYRAVAFATERPLREPVERLLTLIADGQDYAELADLMPKLAVRRYVRWLPGRLLELTEFGRAYVDARRAPRVESLVSVLSVDEAARTVQAIVPAFSAEQPVTVPLDLVASKKTGLGPSELTEATMYAEVNPGAREADLVVLTKIRNPAVEVPYKPGGLVPRPDSPDGAR
ncbi:hypothetical protein PV387_23140 [Streptomyces sp. ME02-6987-2C]|uniref:hypothetical protein n=1 Tax=unclassified Streptomyces TaxID=2593676 RepID=UPI0029B94A55|nr:MULTISPECIES: hypothetical protein [unclassified Streptomyces]MDX3345986.1 hypothetical protein [Streptomyces sp. ME02-6979A]MDX3368898.1 hypothetical protein [Streptomyces sp. ME02-6987-2C]MDX3407795.1 hypothetical protein [Streptomyces sp. ME02-6977A]MDX3421752.1 hypothetical protein [Streptomyces sp. ME02-6985-2c]